MSFLKVNFDINPGTEIQPGSESILRHSLGQGGSLLTSSGLQDTSQPFYLVRFIQETEVATLKALDQNRDVVSVINQFMPENIAPAGTEIFTSLDFPFIEIGLSSGKANLFFVE
jgi:hypothetical protein